MSKSRIPLVLGVAAAGGVGYYLYGAGGNPKVAEKNFEHDAARASSAVKSELPGRGKEAQKSAEAYAKQAGAKLDNAVADGRNKLSSAEAKISESSRNLGKDIQAKIDAADRAVEDAASKAAKKTSGWFGK